MASNEYDDRFTFERGDRVIYVNGSKNPAGDIINTVHTVVGKGHSVSGLQCYYVESDERSCAHRTIHRWGFRFNLLLVSRQDHLFVYGDKDKGMTESKARLLKYGVR
jgi:hypothetical protein